MITLVTGHAGFVGTHLVELLLAGDGEVHGFSRCGWLSDVSVLSGVDKNHQGDIRNYEDIRRVVERVDPDRIFHLAAQAYVPESSTDPHRGVDVNVTGTLNLLEAVRHTGCRARVLVAGTSEEYGYEGHDYRSITEESFTRPTTVYGVTKLAAGQLGLTYARMYGIPVVVTRAWNHTGPGQPSTYAIPSFAKKVAEIESGRRKVLTHGNLDATRSYLDVRDVVRAYAAAVDLPTGVYNVGVDEAMPMSGYLGLLANMSNVDVVLEPDPALYRPGMQTGSKWFPTTEARKLREATGWQPERTIDQTLRDTLDYWRTRI